ncbi:S-layer homology domain-containing protein [Oceanobacillus senegalensis]|uniref:S-layer homology domain-containing protein n=1 Tax=Oceanobacillus senegalensis TaxID=1936063 RepID=UPI000A309490|nr:S-layer homology domain-containing protein [Oceanobacillus senegalensis]
MRKVSMILTALAVIFALFAPAVSAGSAFSDVSSDHWAKEAIDEMNEQEIMQGIGNGEFGPDQTITRLEVAIIISRVLELDTENVDPVDYKDLHSEMDYYEYMAAVIHNDLMVGDGENFNPQDELSRAEAAKVLVNVFELEEGTSINFEDNGEIADWAKDAVEVVVNYGLMTGKPGNEFAPKDDITRAEFATIVSRATDNPQTIEELLKEVYANEMELESYQYEGSMNLGVELPDSLFDESEEALEESLSQLLENIQVDITGSYQKDPMMMDAEMKLTVQSDVEMTIPISMVMTETKMWIKFPPMFSPDPELAGKYVEFDLEELAGLEGQPAMDMEVQTELALDIYNLFATHFSDFYNRVSEAEVDVPENVDVKQVLKFELDNENLQSFLETFVHGFIPGFVELLDNPAYSEALGIPEEELQNLKKQLGQLDDVAIEDLMEEINKVLTINNFEEYVVINQDNQIGYSAVNVDLDITAEGETIGITLSFDQGKSEINEPVTIETPNEEDVVPFEELFGPIEEGFEEFDVESLEL